MRYVCGPLQRLLVRTGPVLTANKHLLWATLPFFLASGCTIKMHLNFAEMQPSSQTEITQALGQGYSVDHIVNSVRTIGDRVMIGGQFRRLGPWTGGFSSLPIRNGEIALSPEAHPVFFGYAWTVVADPSGGYFVGGTFERVNGRDAKRLVKLDGQLRLDESFGLNIADGGVSALAVSGNYLYVGGSFTTVEGSARMRLMRIDRITQTVDNGWNPVLDGAVNSLVIRGDRLVVGGAFTSIDMGTGAQSRSRLAAFSLTDGTLSAWAPATNNTVSQILPFGPSSVFVRGTFTTVNAVARSYLALLDANDDSNASNLRGVAHSFDGAVSGMAIDGSAVYVTGTFRNVDSNLVGSLARLNYAVPSAGALDTSWQPKYNLPASSSTVQVVGDYVYSCTRTIGTKNPVGDLSVVASSGTDAPMLFRVRKDDAAYDAAYSKTVFEGCGGSTIVGNRFFALGHVGSDHARERGRIAQIDRYTRELTSFVADAPDGFVHGFEPGTTNSVYAYGSFTSVNGTNQKGIAKLDLVTGEVDTGFSPVLVRAAGAPEVRSVALVGGVLYVAGRFDSVNGYARNGIALLNPFSGALLANNVNFEVNSESTIQSVYVDTDHARLLLAGSFTSVKNLTTNVTTARNRFAVLNFPVSPSTDFTLNAATVAFDNEVLGLRVPDSSSLYLSGRFTAPTSRIVRLDLATLAVDPGFTPPTFNNWIRDFQIYGGSLYVAGAFSVAGGNAIFRLAKLHPSTGTLDTSFSAFVQDYLYTFEIDEISGNFLGGGYQYGSFNTADTWNLTYGTISPLQAVDANLGSD